MKSSQKSSKLSAKKLRGKVFESIYDLPLFNWWKIGETGDLSYLFIQRRMIRSNELSQLVQIWDAIEGEFIEVFGISQQYAEILQKRVYIAELQVRMIVDEDRSLETLIDVARIELQRMYGDQNRNGFLQTKASVERVLGFHIDATKMTVAEYHTHINNLTKNG